MIVEFRIHFHTTLGQSLGVIGSHPALGEWDSNNLLWLSHEGGGNWKGQIEVENDASFKMSYKYILVHGDHVEWEGGQNRHVQCAFTRAHIIFYDYWRSSRDPQNTLFSSAFSKNIMARQSEPSPRKRSRASQIFRIQLFAPRIDKDHQLILMGDDSSLGNWDPSKARVLDDRLFPLWSVDFSPRKKNRELNYKFAIQHIPSGKISTIEEGPNRVLWVDGSQTDSIYIKTDYPFSYPLGNWKGAGWAIPVFSLKSKTSLGVGEFNDLKPLVDWSKSCGMKLIQLLPINDTHTSGSKADSSPYSANSSFALHPIYTHIDPIARGSQTVTESYLDHLRTRLNKETRVNYPEVYKLKIQLLKSLFEEQKERFIQDPEVKQFFEKHKHWLYPYGLFHTFLELYGSPKPDDWNEYANYQDLKPEHLAWSTELPFFDQVCFHVFVQFHLHNQLLEASNYARTNHVVLKGDIPIGVKRESVDTWVFPHLFNLDAQAGAPPDDFAQKGQNWGMPTYNWEEMRKNGFQWWKNRLQHMSQYFDSFRVDHILGFFRIWEIPEGARQGLLGVFNKSVPIHAHEIYSRGIPFQYDRMCQPYITDSMLDSLFGWRKDGVVETFFDREDSGRFRFKPNFENQDKVHAHFEIIKKDSQDPDPYSAELREKLLYLHTEVLFIESPFPHSQLFHPRHSIDHTQSFKDLDPWVQHQVKDLYNDYFFHRQEDFWRLEGLWKLPALKYATEMLICGEDLGMVPKCVPQVMEELNILGLRIQRMPGDSSIRFGHPSDYNYLSVCTTSSHDMAPIRAWWEQGRDKNQVYYETILGKSSPAPYYAEDWLCREIITQHLYSPSMWAIFPIQDLLAMDFDLRLENPFDEQINDPSNPDHSWDYRLHKDLETFIEAHSFNQMLRTMVFESGRGSDY